ncbi:MAG: glycosyltransferase family 4 protein, partial [Nitrososphaerota archaeon]|nr:glycosyltransferase family 4 protein [Nitrososphaerota archaeon]
EYKGVNVLLDAISIINSSGNKVNLTIVGTGPELENLKRKSRTLGIEGSTRFLGNVSDKELLRLYSTCDSVVLPSLNRREAFGIVLLEAMAAGKNVVASDIPGVNEIAAKGGGFLAKPNDARSLANSIMNSLSKKDRFAVVRKVAQDHSWDKLAAKYETIFHELIGAD